jgi:hypothetical protein
VIRIKGQASTEFLIVSALMLMLFSTSLLLYFMNLHEGSVVKERLEATQLCLETASTLGAFASLGGNSTYTLNLSQSEIYKNYTVWINSEQKVVKVNYGEFGVSCRLPFSNFTNSNGSRIFALEKNASLRNEYGVVYIE